MLFCPACTSKMGEVTAGSVAADLCGACGGVWLDAGELEKIPRRDAALLSGAHPDPDALHGPRHCPRCLGPRALFALRRQGVVIDQCGSCHGIFLDPGELAAVRNGRRGMRRRSRRQEDGAFRAPEDVLSTLFAWL